MEKSVVSVVQQLIINQNDSASQLQLGDPVQSTNNQVVVFNALHRTLEVEKWITEGDELTVPDLSESIETIFNRVAAGLPATPRAGSVSAIGMRSLNPPDPESLYQAKQMVEQITAASEARLKELKAEMELQEQKNFEEKIKKHVPPPPTQNQSSGQ